jgi:hypothetical protein
MGRAGSAVEEEFGASFDTGGGGVIGGWCRNWRCGRGGEAGGEGSGETIKAKDTACR